VSGEAAANRPPTGPEPGLGQAKRLVDLAARRTLVAVLMTEIKGSNLLANNLQLHCDESNPLGLRIGVYRSATHEQN
jgi:hypothetical protein